VAGGNKSHSPKVKKRVAQMKATARKASEDKKKRFGRWSERDGNQDR
jgi:hypothetical protein